MNAFIDGYIWFLLTYVVTHSLIQLLISLSTWRIVRRDAGWRSTELQEAPMSGLEPPITVVVPAYNEEQTIVTSVRSMLQLRYPEYEVVVVNDGSRDNTLQVLREAFELAPFPPSYQRRLVTEKVRGIYRSPKYPGLRVIDKENGGKADAINCGINAARFPLFCCVDADSILSRDSLLLVAQPFVEDPRTVACGGTVRLANGCIIRQGLLVQAGVPRSVLARLQIVQYLRAFQFGRMGWARWNGLLIISGAFGLMRKDTVIEAGGYRRNTIGEDMELIVRLHRLLVEKGRAYRITYLPDPICWTQAPEDWRTLRNQRVRWQRGLCESLWSNKGLMRSRSVAGWLAFPYFVLFEWAAPLVEMSGYLLFVVLLASDSVRWPVSGLFLLIALAFGILLTTVALTLDEISFHVYPRARNLFELFLTGIVENFGYRQINVVWRLTGMWRWVRGTQAQWGVMQRKGLEQPTRKP